ncbi:DNA-directed DNA polymerase [Senna tora]|uniref:DNA-directed DNA polymerase n=1 Tax=Senna tora TaxID=362788 RepID=A0A834XF33_9FABA|nr:DNA-directed DNA polymerase [Senna tora]
MSKLNVGTNKDDGRDDVLQNAAKDVVHIEASNATQTRVTSTEMEVLGVSDQNMLVTHESMKENIDPVVKPVGVKLWKRVARSGGMTPCHEFFELKVSKRKGGLDCVHGEEENGLSMTKKARCAELVIKNKNNISSAKKLRKEAKAVKRALNSITLTEEFDNLFDLSELFAEEKSSLINMAKEKALKELDAPPVQEAPLCITAANPQAPLELKSGLIHLLPKFKGLGNEDP